MQYALTAAAFAAVAFALPQAQAPPSIVRGPGAPADASCQTSYDGTFGIQVVNVTSSQKAKRQVMGTSDAAGTLIITLNDGVLRDSEDRIGNIVANNQFQFDSPLQDNTKITTGWAICPNGTLVLGDDAVFKQCLSGDFYNLYDENGAGQCTDIYIQVINSNGAAAGTPAPSASATAAASVSQIADGQPQGATSAAPVTQIGDGQVQAATSGAPVTQIGDGQIQAATSGAPVTQIGDGQIQAATSGAPVTQIGDGQIQAATSGAPVTQIADGQIQASTGAVPVTQIADGQIQVPTGAPVTQIADGQIQAPTGAPVTQISDGQIQAPTGAPVTQISDGQIQAPTNGTVSPTPSVQPYTGAAAIPTAIGSGFGLAIAAVVVAML